MDNLENLLKEHLKKHFAKSDGETTLEQHINDLLEQFKDIFG
jgi:hypothetical protein